MENKKLQIPDIKNPQTDSKKVWEIPAIVEISKFEILANAGRGNDGNNPSGNNSLT